MAMAMAMALAAGTGSAISAALPRPPRGIGRIHSSTPVVAMASVPRFQPSPVVASASPLPVRALRRGRRRSLSTVYAVLKGWTSVPVTATGPANGDESVFLITLDLSGAPLLLNSFKTPGQYVLTRVPPGPGETKRNPAYMSICSAPRSGPRFELLVRSVPGTTSELLCKLKVGDLVELGPCVGQGFSHPIENINPPQAAETVLMLAVMEGISPIRSLIKYGFAAKERENVKLYYGAPTQEAMPLRGEIMEWEQTGVTVQQVIAEPVQLAFFRDLPGIIRNPDSTAALLVGPKNMEEEVVGVLTDYGVPHDKILTYQGWHPDY